MLRAFLVVTSAVSFCSQAAAQQAIFEPSVRAQLNFGGPANSDTWAAYLSLAALREQQTYLEQNSTEAAQRPSYLSFKSSQTRGSELFAFGAPVLDWGQPKQAEFALNQNGESTKTGSWFSRNWWVVALGVVAVGVAAAATSGGSDSNQSSGGGNTTNCGVGGNVVGPGGVVVSPNCPAG